MKYTVRFDARLAAGYNPDDLIIRSATMQGVQAAGVHAAIEQAFQCLVHKVVVPVEPEAGSGRCGEVKVIEVVWTCQSAAVEPASLEEFAANQRERDGEGNWLSRAVGRDRR